MDLFFSPHCGTLLTGYPPAVVTIHDLTPALMPLHSRRITAMLKFFLFSAVRFSEVVITDSDYTKKQLMSLYGVPESKVSVVHLGCDHERFNRGAINAEQHEQSLSRFGIKRPYILHHGVAKPNKNLKRLIQAYRLMLERNSTLDVGLVLAGPLGLMGEELLSEAAKLGAKGRVTFTGPLGDNDLVLLLKGATLVAIPSLNEGFCLPMVEAMACGIPTVCANASCLPEICGGVLRFFDPYEVEDIANCIEEALVNDVLRMQLSVEGQRRAQNFTWLRCAQETLRILERVATSHSRKKARGVAAS